MIPNICTRKREHVTWSIAVYITNGDGLLGDSLLVRFTDILDVYKTMRDFQTWLITQVGLMVSRGATCQVISELPVCPDCTVYTSQSAEQDNKTHLTWPKTSCAYWL